MAAKITHLLCVFTLAFLTVAITTSSAYGTTEPSYPYQQQQQQQPQPDDLENPSFVKPDVNLHLDHKTSFYVPKVPKVQKPEVAQEHPAYVPTTPEVEKPNVEHGYQPEEPILEKEVLIPKSIGVQGLVYCQSGTERTPIEGAVARVTCLTVDQYGYQAAHLSFLCNPTDKNGYFFTPLDLSSVAYKVTECKVFLDSCPLKTCSHATDINKGVSGALLGPNYHLLPNNKMNLFSVGPFVYTPEEPKSPNGGY
ncbi:Pollen Ole e 1 allergen/extensin [Macleaya cordata]|uniref:Pollen Ole e 1 allergen/extensin n=1 Tax=Macleaya cordata TaxID=56857 RepID=A0A200PWL7_MACCD|nr:Pollen Ole e 1 allergen/extensin [Macleaya cordata]